MIFKLLRRTPRPKLYNHHCLRCGHRWRSTTETPVRCPATHCRSSYWDKPRKRKEA